MKYFSINEMCNSTVAKRKKIDNTPNDEIIEHLTELINVILDPLREAWGNPIVVTSGYRSQKLNRAVGGVATSAHMLGYAADIHPANLENKKFMEFAEKWLKENNIPFDQLLNEYPDKNGNPSWIHIGYKNKSGKCRKQIKIIS